MRKNGQKSSKMTKKRGQKRGKTSKIGPKTLEKAVFGHFWPFLDFFI
jgi:hypothetical protein